MRRLGFRLQQRLFRDICEARSGSDKLNRGRIYSARGISGTKGLVLCWWLAWLGCVVIGIYTGPMSIYIVGTFAGRAILVSLRNTNYKAMMLQNEYNTVK